MGRNGPRIPFKKRWVKLAACLWRVKINLKSSIGSESFAINKEVKLISLNRNIYTRENDGFGKSYSCPSLPFFTCSVSPFPNRLLFHLLLSPETS